MITTIHRIAMKTVNIIAINRIAIISTTSARAEPAGRPRADGGNDAEPLNMMI